LSQSASALSFQFHSIVLDTNLIRTSKETPGSFQQRNSILDIGEHVQCCSPLVRSNLLPLALLSSAAAFFLASAKRSLMEDESATEFILASFGLVLSRPKAFWIKLVRSWKEKVKVKRERTKLHIKRTRFSAYFPLTLYFFCTAGRGYFARQLSTLE